VFSSEFCVNYSRLSESNATISSGWSCEHNGPGCTFVFESICAIGRDPDNNWDTRALLYPRGSRLATRTCRQSPYLRPVPAATLWRHWRLRPRPALRAYGCLTALNYIRFTFTPAHACVRAYSIRKWLQHSQQSVTNFVCRLPRNASATFMHSRLMRWSKIEENLPHERNKTHWVQLFYSGMKLCHLSVQRL